ncbi:MAG: protease inhibitor I42 family protein [Methanomicrobiales archaeon]|nr:protease inhibitor I42 family protein [Methanomicrobiales archaeon]MDD1654298.1 protease inhibitor I42 family protein [Methanomicrobiales archaeon]
MQSIPSLAGLLAAGLLVTALLMAGCTSTVYTESNNGQTISAAKDSMVTIRLKENPTTGYSWQVNVTPGLSIVHDEYIPDKVPAGMVGSGGTHTWTVQPVDSGTFAFSGIYMQPWMNVTGSESTYTLTIVAK